MFDQRLDATHQSRHPPSPIQGIALWGRRLFAVIASIFALAATGAVLTGPASAQQAVVFVNGEPITALDVERRARLLQLTTQRQPARQDVIQELVDERIKIHQARRLNISISDSDVERAFSAMARQSGLSTQNFESALKQARIEPRSFRAKLRADLAWREVLQQMAPGAFQVRDADLVAALTARGERPRATATQYSLRQFVFVVPRGSPDSFRAARVREAESLRAKFSNCETDVHLAREFREVVVQDPVIQISSDLPARLQELLAKTPDGRMTPPEPTAAGISVVAVCGRKETVADLSSRSEIRDELLSQRVQREESQLIERLRRQAIIEYR